MSSKKARRRKRQEHEEESRRRRVSPAVVFIVSIGMAVLLIVVGSIVLMDRSDRGEPPHPGAVWSAAHGHWH